MDYSMINYNVPGTYIITYTATDAAGNITTKERTVIVQDTIGPVINLNGGDTTYVTMGEPYIEQGATANDSVDGTVSVSIVFNNVDTSEIGGYTVTYIATDSTGNTSTKTRNVIVPDETAPVITLNGGDVTIPVQYTSANGSINGGTYNELGASATDNVDGTVTVSIDNNQVDTSTVGVYTVTYTATDAAGNQSQETITVTVEEDWTGIVHGSTSLTDSTIQTAVDQWIDGGLAAKENVITTYGLIENWDTSQVTNMNKLFGSDYQEVTNKPDFNDDISRWDVSNVTDMSNMFLRCNFNQKIGYWDVSKVTDMSYMFSYARRFNQPVGTWDVSNVTTMRFMFSVAEDFNQPLGTWDVSNATSLYGMFSNARKFNQDIRGWTPHEDVNMIMMFAWGGNIKGAMEINYRGTTGFDDDNPQATFFNQYAELTNSTIKTAVNHWIAGGTAKDNVISTYGSIEIWKTSQVTDMVELFKDATTFNDNIGMWNVSNVTTMRNMFNGASAFNQDIGYWDVSKVTIMSEMFRGASSFNQDIGKWDVSSVQHMSYMLYGAAAFNQPIESWDVSNVGRLYGTFGNAAAFNQPIGSWNVSNVTDMVAAFRGAAAFNQPIGSWNVSNVTNMEDMFNGAAAFNQPIGSWDVAKVSVMKEMFEGATAFNQDIRMWAPATRTSHQLSLYNMFKGATAMHASFSSPIFGDTPDEMWFNFSNAEEGGPSFYPDDTDVFDY